MAGTGANSIPLGTLHPIFSQNKPAISGESSMLSAAREAAARVTANIKREHGGGGGHATVNKGPESTNWPLEKRRKKSRWGAEETRATAAVIPANLSKEQEHQVLMHLQIEDITRKLRTGDLGIPPNPEDRSPSPEPVYNHEGKRLNTREYRTRKKLEEERHIKIQDALASNPEYKPPADYKPPVQRVNDRVMIPQEEHPDINFVGLLIGPRGNTLKKLEKDTGTKIMIRGKGSVKEGKVGRKDGQPLPGEDEPLHALVTANSSEAVKKAVDQIHTIIRHGIDAPEGQNELKRSQLRELAALNGTLRDGDVCRCSNCGATAHRTWQCPEKQNVTSNILCTICGGAGHIAQDCRNKGNGQGPPPTAPTNTVDKAKMDSEYLSLMAELGEGPPPAPQSKMSNNNHSSQFQPQPPPLAPGPRPLLARPPHPPPLMGSGPVPPPWMKDKPPSLLGSPAGPPPHHNHGHHGGPPPPHMHHGHHGGPGGSMPPHHHHNHHPPPPPPSLMSQMLPPPPMNMSMPPPPFGGGNMPPPWAMPPPPPGSQPATSVSSASRGLSPVPPPSLLAAPPPPPPPSSEPPPPLPTSAPWQTQTSSTGATGSVSVATTTSTQQHLPWQLNTGSAATTTTTSSSVPPWQVSSPSPTSTSATVTATNMSVPPPPPQWAPPPPPGPPQPVMPPMGMPPPMSLMGVPPPPSTFQPPMPQGPPPPLPFSQPPPPMDMSQLRPPVPPLVGAPPPPPPPSN